LSSLHIRWSSKYKLTDLIWVVNAKLVAKNLENSNGGGIGEGDRTSMINEVHSDGLGLIPRRVTNWSGFLVLQLKPMIEGPDKTIGESHIDHSA
jgi:hypothetical protein